MTEPAQLQEPTDFCWCSEAPRIRCSCGHIFPDPHWSSSTGGCYHSASDLGTTRLIVNHRTTTVLGPKPAVPQRH
jgi:hypothetical protein